MLFYAIDRESEHQLTFGDRDRIALVEQIDDRLTIACPNPLDSRKGQDHQQQDEAAKNKGQQTPGISQSRKGLAPEPPSDRHEDQQHEHPRILKTNLEVAKHKRSWLWTLKKPIRACQRRLPDPLSANSMIRAPIMVENGNGMP